MLGFCAVSEAPVSALPVVQAPAPPPPPLATQTKQGGSADSGATILRGKRQRTRRSAGYEGPDYTPDFSDYHGSATLTIGAQAYVSFGKHWRYSAQPTLAIGTASSVSSHDQAAFIRHREERMLEWGGSLTDPFVEEEVCCNVLQNLPDYRWQPGRLRSRE